MPTRNVFLSEQFDSFIASGIEEGRYSNASEVVREGLRLLQQRDAEDQAKIAWLRGAVQEGTEAIERGDYIVLNTAEDIDAMMDDIRRATKAEPASV
ncbi:MAG: type II toxin-antitoxin system ParD family antitoxin [Janthinobacterium lividum]